MTGPDFNREEIRRRENDETPPRLRSLSTCPPCAIASASIAFYRAVAAFSQLHGPALPLPAHFGSGAVFATRLFVRPDKPQPHRNEIEPEAPVTTPLPELWKLGSHSCRMAYANSSPPIAVELYDGDTLQSRQEFPDYETALAFAIDALQIVTRGR